MLSPEELFSAHPGGELPSGNERESLLSIALHIPAEQSASQNGSGIGLVLRWCKKHRKGEERA